MSSVHWVTAHTLDPHIAWLLSQLEPRADAVKALHLLGAKQDIFCYCLGSLPEPPAVSDSLLRRARALGIPIDIDYYAIS